MMLATHRLAIATALAFFMAPLEVAHAQVLVTQPYISALGPLMFNPHSGAEHFPFLQFGMVIWEPNPYRIDGQLVPISNWDAGAKTGLHVVSMSVDQLGYVNRPNTTIAQASGGSVGAYLNSDDLSSFGMCSKMEIAPQYRFRPTGMKYPFASTNGAINVSFDLQVPTAVGGTTPFNNVFVSADLQYLDPIRKVQISNGIKIFLLNSSHPGLQSVGYDQPSGSYMLNTPLAAGSTWVRQLPGSGSMTGMPWTGYRTFTFQVSYQGLKLALSALRTTYPTLHSSLNPKDYGFVMFHLNAAFHCGSGHAELGWSMRNLTVSLAKAK